MHDAVAITLAAVLAAAVAHDLRARRIPNLLTLPACLGFLVLRLALSGADGLISGLAGLGLGLALMLPAYGLGVMGGGDVKLAGLVGLVLGWHGWTALVVGAAAAFVLGAGYALGLVLLRRATRATHIAFGPWMIVGAVLGISAA